MEFKKTYEKDAGPIVRWIATGILALLSKIEKPLYDYAIMYEVFFDDEDEEDDFATPHNQMLIPGMDWHEEWGEDEDYV